MTNTTIEWRAVKKKAEAAIEAERTALETPGMPAAERDYRCGKIAAYREILSFEKGPAPEITAPAFVHE